MMVSTDRIISITEADQNLSKIAKRTSADGDVVIFKRNKPAYVKFDVAGLSDDMMNDIEKLRIRLLCEQLIAESGEAYGQLAK